MDLFPVRKRLNVYTFSISTTLYRQSKDIPKVKRKDKGKIKEMTEETINETIKVMIGN